MYIANMQTKGNTHQVTVKQEISNADYASFMKKFDFLKDISPVKIAYDIVVRNAHEFVYFMNEEHLKRMHFVEKMDLGTISIDGNRLLFNMCASFLTFIDYSTKAVSHKNKAKENFKDFLSNEFDDSFEYRFFYKLRNYCTHYSFPFSTITVTDPGVVILSCKKEHLLEYDGWGKVKNDIEKLPEDIAICSYINELLTVITGVMIQTHYYFVEEYYIANKAIAELIEQYAVPSPIFAEDKENGNKTLHPIPIENIMTGMDIVKSHPGVHFTYAKSASEMKMEPANLFV